MFEFLNINAILAAGQLTQLSNQDAIMSCFKSIRQGVLGISDTFVSLALALAGLFVGIKLIKLSYDTMSDEQGGGLGGVKLSQILVPMIMIALIAGYKYFIGALDYTVGIVVDNIADTSQISDRVNSSLHGMELTLDAADNTFLSDAQNVLKDYDSNFNKNQSSSTTYTGNYGTSSYGATSAHDLTMKQDFSEGAAYSKYSTFEDEEGNESSNLKAIKKILKQYGKALAKSNQEASGSHGLIANIVSLLFNTVFLIILAMANLYLCLFVLLGPFTIAFSLFDRWQGAFMSFVGKYIEISFWMVIAVIINWITTAAASICIDSVQAQYASQLAEVFEFGTSGAEAYYKFSKCITTVNLIRIAGLLALFSVPDIASAILSLGGGSAMGGATTGATAAKSVATTAGQAPGKAAGVGGNMVLHKKGLM